MSSEKLLNLEEFVDRAKKEGIDFGKGEPYNRIRYYIKMEWIPHMERRGKNVEGHYPEWVIDRLKLIQELKNKGLSNDEITQEINKKKKIKPLLQLIQNEKFKKRILIVGLAAIIALVILSEMDIIKIGKSKEEIIPQQKPQTALFP